MQPATSLPAVDEPTRLIDFPNQHDEPLAIEFEGQTLRPLSYASFYLLKRTGNALINRLASSRLDAAATLSCEDADSFFALLAFVYLHAAPVEEATRAALGDRDEFEVAVCIFTESFPVCALPFTLTFSAAHVSAIHAFQAQAE